MRQDLIELKFHPSKLAIILMLIADITLLLLITLANLPSLISFALFTLGILANYIFIKQNLFNGIIKLDILTEINQIVIHLANGRKQSYPIKQIKSIGYMVVIIYFDFCKKSKNIPIFIDSTNIISYKQLRRFMLW